MAVSDNDWDDNFPDGIFVVVKSNWFLTPSRLTPASSLAPQGFSRFLSPIFLRVFSRFIDFA